MEVGVWKSSEDCCERDPVEVMGNPAGGGGKYGG